MNTETLPAGTYILNNGPRKKGQGGRFVMGTHRMLKQLMKDMPEVVFTDKPEKADFVILPEGVREPGSKLLRRNPALKDPRRVFAMDQIAHVMRSEAYQRRKWGLMYTVKDSQGRDVQIDVPVNLEPSDQSFTQAIAKVDQTRKIDIPPGDYPVWRRVVRGGAQPVIVPTPPLTGYNSVPAPPANVSSFWANPAPFTTPQSTAWPPPKAPILPTLTPSPTLVSPATATALALGSVPLTAPLANKLAQLDQLLNQFTGAPPPPPPPRTIPTPGQTPFSTLPSAPPLSRPPLGPLSTTAAAADSIYRPSASKQQVEKAYGQLVGGKLYRWSQDHAGDLAAIFRTLKRDASQMIIELMMSLETLRQALTHYVHDLQQRDMTNVSQVHEAFSVVRSVASTIHTDLNDTWKSMTALLQHMAGLTAPWTLVQVIEMVAYLGRLLQLLNEELSKYRQTITTDGRKTAAGTKCTEANLWCDAKNQPIDITEALYTLLNVSCQLVQQPAESFPTRLAWTAQCTNMELSHSTLCDVYNMLFLDGFCHGQYGGKVRMAVSGESFCEHIQKAVEEVCTVYLNQWSEERARQPDTPLWTLPGILASLQQLSPNNLWYVDTVRSQTLYHLFYQFLLRTSANTGTIVIVDRTQTFQTLKTVIQSLYASRQNELYLMMTLAALFFALANFCTGSNDGYVLSGTNLGDFSVKAISQIMKVNSLGSKAKSS